MTKCKLHDGSEVSFSMTLTGLRYEPADDGETRIIADFDTHAGPRTMTALASAKAMAEWMPASAFGFVVESAVNGTLKEMELAALNEWRNQAKATKGDE